MEYQKNGGKTIQKKIHEVKDIGGNQLELSKNYEIEQTIVLPCDFTLTLNGCHLKMADNTFCRMFMNEKAVERENGIFSGLDNEIHLLGRNGATLDGGNYNGLSEKNYKDTPHHISVNNILLFAGLEHFSVRGIRVVRQRWWALCFVDCAFGDILDMDFLSDDRRLVNGELIPGLLRHEYFATYIKNSDGIDLRLGCHDIAIRNITGFTEDDTIALTALRGDVEEIFHSPSVKDAIHHVQIIDVQATAYCTIVRLLNQGKTKLHDISIENVEDTCPKTNHCDSGIYAVRIGDTHRYSKEDKDVPPCCISVKNIIGCGKAALQIACKVENLVVENIVTAGKCMQEIETAENE